MIVIGVDIHKRSHTLVAVNSATGVQAEQATISASDAGHADALRFARGLGDQVVWALEDCRHVSGRLERALVAAGEQVIRVWPTLMGASRKGERQPGKSDPIDALAVARAVVRDGVDAFPAAFLDEEAMEIRLLHDHREHLVDHRTRLANRLRVHLLALDPELEAEIPMRGLDQPVTTTRSAAASPDSSKPRESGSLATSSLKSSRCRARFSSCTTTSTSSPRPRTPRCAKSSASARSPPRS
jgi:transposase